MKDNKQDGSSIQNILNDVDSAVMADRAAKEKRRKRATIIAIMCIVCVATLIGYVANKSIQDRQFREELLEEAISVTLEYGVDDLTIVSASSGGYPRTVVFQSDMFTALSDEDKMKIFRKFNKLTGTYSGYFNCEDKDRVVIVSNETRYTAEINEYGSSYYRYLYADGDKILKDTYTKPSSSSSGSSNSGKTKCSRCSGTGKVTQHFGNSWNQKEGYKYGEKCGACGGTGYR